MISHRGNIISTSMIIGHTALLLAIVGAAERQLSNNISGGCS